MQRKFKVDISEDEGKTWTSKKAGGWPVAELGLDAGYGYTIAMNHDNTWLDVEIPHRVLKLMLRDIRRLEKKRANIQQQQET